MIVVGLNEKCSWCKEKNKMRKRKEIDKEIELYGTSRNVSLATLEVMLDIRELLEDIKNE